MRRNVSYWHGSVRRRALLGKEAAGARTYGETHGSKPYVKANKTDAADAEAICEAVSRPTMRFVPIKNVEQQAVPLHRARQGFVRARTASANQLRGLLVEYGITLPQGISHVTNGLPAIVEDAANDLPGVFRKLLQRLGVHLRELNRQVEELEQQIDAWHRSNEKSQKLAQIPGIGPLTATALVASIGDARCFNNGRELAAWLGLVPRQHSSSYCRGLVNEAMRTLER